MREGGSYVIKNGQKVLAERTQPKTPEPGQPKKPQRRREGAQQISRSSTDQTS